MSEKQQSRSLSTRCAILSAAGRLVSGCGPASLTIDAVAREAGVSKGGVLYHYRSKDALVKGLIRTYHQDFWRDFARFWKNDPRREGRWHRSWIRAHFEEFRRPQEKDFAEVALFAAVMADPEMVGYLSRQVMRGLRCLAWDGLDPESSMLLTNAVAGFKLHRMLPLRIGALDLDSLEAKCLAMLEQLVSGDFPRMPDVRSLTGKADR